MVHIEHFLKIKKEYVHIGRTVSSVHTPRPSREAANASGPPPQGLLPGPETLLFYSILGPS